MCYQDIDGQQGKAIQDTLLSAFAFTAVVLVMGMACVETKQLRFKCNSRKSPQARAWVSRAIVTDHGIIRPQPKPNFLLQPLSSTNLVPIQGAKHNGPLVRSSLHSVLNHHLDVSGGVVDGVDSHFVADIRHQGVLTVVLVVRGVGHFHVLRFAGGESREFFITTVVASHDDVFDGSDGVAPELAQGEHLVFEASAALGRSGNSQVGDAKNLLSVAERLDIR